MYVSSGGVYGDYCVSIGRTSVIVKIDESKCGKMKYGRGKLVDAHWVF